MNLIDIILLAFALGIDCFVVSFSQGLIFKSRRFENSIRLALVMGLFQGFMPIIGYIAAGRAYSFLVPYSKYIVAGIFFILGLHFIVEAYSKGKEQVQCIGMKCLLGLGVATSIDALISGSSIKLTSTNPVLSCITIGICSFVMSLTGFWIGNFIKKIPSVYLHILGGSILILLGIKSLY